MDKKMEFLELFYGKVLTVFSDFLSQEIDINTDMKNTFYSQELF